MKLTRKNWEDAAYGALLRAGPSAVAVAKLADELGATRGSFYHYFDDRDELLAATLARWEHEATERFIVRANVESNPADRLRTLFADVFGGRSILADAELHLAAHRATDSMIGQAVERVTSTRLTFLTDCYEEMGLARPEASERAHLAYLVFTGWLHADQRLHGAGSSIPFGIEELAVKFLIDDAT